jgi:hypothetical protein
MTLQIVGLVTTLIYSKRHWGFMQLCADMGVALPLFSLSIPCAVLVQFALRIKCKICTPYHDTNMALYAKGTVCNILFICMAWKDSRTKRFPRVSHGLLRISCEEITFHLDISNKHFLVSWLVVHTSSIFCHNFPGWGKNSPFQRIFLNSLGKHIFYAFLFNYLRSLFLGDRRPSLTTL